LAGRELMIGGLTAGAPGAGVEPAPGVVGIGPAASFTGPSEAPEGPDTVAPAGAV
jgi:hypothetical protein